MLNHDRIHEALIDLAAIQHGVVSARQARELGATPTMLRRMASSRGWHRSEGRGLVRTGTPASEGQLLSLAVHDIGPTAFLSHRTAAAWWEIPGFSLLSRPVHVSRPRSSLGRVAPFAREHVVRDVRTDHVVRHRGVPVSSPARMIFELAAHEHPGKVERSCDHALAMELTSTQALHQMLDDLGKRGRAGISVMRELLEARPVTYVPVASGIEGRFIDLATKHMLGAFRRQVDLGGSDGWVGRVDFLHRDLPVVVEVQSRRHHLSLTDRASDERRFEQLRRAGYAVVTVWDEELWCDPMPALERVWEALQRARVQAA